MRHNLNLRYTARERPHNWHRCSMRELNFGFLFAFTTCAAVAIFSPSPLLIPCVRHASQQLISIRDHFIAVLLEFLQPRSGNLFLRERDSDLTQQQQRLGVGTGSRDDRNVHSLHIRYSIWIDFGKHGLLIQSHTEVPVAIKPG